MRAAGVTVFRLGLTLRLGLALSASLLALSVGSAQEVEIPVSDLPQPVLSSADIAAPDRQAETNTLSEPPVVPPDLPAVTVSVPAAEAGPAPAALSDIVLPGVPEAPVTLTDDDRFRTFLESRLATFVPDASSKLARKEREAIARFYEARQFRPVWLSAGSWTPAARAAMRQLRVADEDGLNAEDYPLPAFSSQKAIAPEDTIGAELMLAASVVAYARDARGARVDPGRLSNLLTPTIVLPAADEILSRVSAAPDAAAALAAYNPPHAGYRALKSRLAQLRANRLARPTVRVPQGRALRVGMRDPRVPLIRARLNLRSASGDANAYDERVASAVASFQRENGLPVTGVLTKRTIAALRGGPSPERVEGDLVANMERWRWLPADLGERHIAVNVPEFRLRIVDGGDTVHQTRVIVGRPETPTPIFSDEMETVIVNPSWTVPPSIVKKEILPALANDPTYAARRGYRVLRRGNRIIVQQPPGERNALGFIKFIFPNDHAVYLHDTPSRKLFSADRRAFSHGCVRVDQPFRLAEEILQIQGSWPEKRLRGLIGKGERYIRLKEHLPVHMTYFTMSVDDKGNLKSFDDLYGFHEKVRGALGLEG